MSLRFDQQQCRGRYVRYTRQKTGSELAHRRTADGRAVFADCALSGKEGSMTKQPSRKER
eukprot:13784-Heterococcus_DN1.PRE.2